MASLKIHLNQLDQELMVCLNHSPILTIIMDQNSCIRECMLSRCNQSQKIFVRYLMVRSFVHFGQLNVLKFRKKVFYKNNFSTSVRTIPGQEV